MGSGLILVVGLWIGGHSTGVTENSLAWEKAPHIWCQKCLECGSSLRLEEKHNRRTFFLHTLHSAVHHFDQSCATTQNSFVVWLHLEKFWSINIHNIWSSRLKWSHSWCLFPPLPTRQSQTWVLYCTFCVSLKFLPTPTLPTSYKPPSIPKLSVSHLLPSTHAS